MNNLTTNIDPFMVDYIESNTIWFCTLSNNLIVYMDDYRPNREPYSAWTRLQEYCASNRINIINMTLRFRSNHYRVGENKEGFFFRKMARGSIKHPTLHFFVVGYIENNYVKTFKIKTPELILDSEEERSIDECRESIIFNSF